jgi:phosphoribosylanthranilate isomerase
MRVKVCGLRSRAEIADAVAAGAAYVGLVFFPPSPRHLTIADARWIVPAIPEGVTRVALTVNAADPELEALLEAVPLDMLQLHGAETPERVAEIRQRFGRPVMKAVGVAEEEDLEALSLYSSVADQILVDARAPKQSDRPGGHGRPFDWRLVRTRAWARPWMLAGGLTPQNVGEAIRVTGAEQVDVSSGVESSPGHKDARLVAAFVRAARDAERLEA